MSTLPLSPAPACASSRPSFSSPPVLAFLLGHVVQQPRKQIGSWCVSLKPTNRFNGYSHSLVLPTNDTTRNPPTQSTHKQDKRHGRGVHLYRCVSSNTPGERERGTERWLEERVLFLFRSSFHQMIINYKVNDEGCWMLDVGRVPETRIRLVRSFICCRQSFFFFVVRFRVCLPSAERALFCLRWLQAQPTFVLFLSFFDADRLANEHACMP